MLILFDNGTPRTLACYLIDRHAVTEAAVNTTRYLATQFSAFNEVGLHLLQRDSFFVLP